MLGVARRAGGGGGKGEEKQKGCNLISSTMGWMGRHMTELMEEWDLLFSTANCSERAEPFFRQPVPLWWTQQEGGSVLESPLPPSTYAP